MRYVRLAARLSVVALLVSGCGGGSADSENNPEVSDQSTLPASGANISNVDSNPAPTDVAADSTTYTVYSIAGHESGLVKLAAIDDTIAAGKRDEVIVRYSGAAATHFPVSAPGKLHNCEGVFNRKNCDVFGTVTYEQPGTYTYTVTYESAGLFGGTVDLTGSIVVSPPGPFVVVSIGDSVASGEGSPVISRLEGDEYFAKGYWDDHASNFETVTDTKCHRSSFAGPVLAADRLAANPNNDITFIHIACSGAKFNFIQQGDYTGGNYRIGQLGKIDTQLYWIRERFEQVDVLLISGGANNINGGFGSVVEACLGPGDCSQDDAFVDSLRRSMFELPEKYDHFAELLNFGTDASGRADWGDLPQQTPDDFNLPEVVAITEYFDPTRNENGVFPSDSESAACTVGTIKQSEWEFLYNEMVVPLNREVMFAADRHGWVYVGGIADAFRTHGYCSSPGVGDVIGDAWVVKAPESFRLQGDQQGTAHPDYTGQSVYGNRIYAELVNANPPRTSATATTEGQPYTFGTWVNTDVEVTLLAYNPIEESGVSGTNFAINEPLCTYESVYSGACTQYDMPFLVSDSGRNTVSFFSVNNNGAPEKYTDPVEVLIDREPPEMTCNATPNELWPPNNKMVDIAVSVTAVDEVSGEADFWLFEIRDSLGEELTAVQDFELNTADLAGRMLAKRNGSGARTYTLTYASADHLGNTGYCDAHVIVPHDQRKN